MATRFTSSSQKVLRPILQGFKARSHMSSRSYRAAVCKTLKKPLVIEDLPVKPLKNDQVRVGVQYCGVNYADLLLSLGQYQEKLPLPAVFGAEVAGTVLEVGKDVKNVAEGDHVLGVNARMGGFADQCVVNSQAVLKVPKSLDLREVSALAISYGTAWMSLVRRANIQEGESVLITAAAGGVGMAAVDIASNVLNAKVIGAAGGEEKTKLVLAKGAQSVIDYKTENIRQKVKELTNGKGVDVVLESTGGETMIDCIKCLTWEGRLVVIGFLSGQIPQIPASLLLVKNCSAVGIYWGPYFSKKTDVALDCMNTLLNLLEERKIHPHISKIFPLDQINHAFEFIWKRKSTGKVLISMQNMAKL